jgi:exodeoxyribonuclease-3
VFATHLVATDDDARAREVARFVELLGPRDLGAEPVLLIGDLNALSRRDPYPDDLGEQLARAGIRKYGQPPRFDVMDSVFARGFVDSLACEEAEGGGAGERARGARARARARDWVTARRGPPHARVDTRTDYVLLSPSLLGALVESRVVDVGDASDHHAVVATFA